MPPRFWALLRHKGFRATLVLCAPVNTMYIITTDLVEGVRPYGDRVREGQSMADIAPQDGSTDVSVDSTQVKRFRGALMQAMALKSYSQRELCEKLGITIGTMTKYLRGSVDPMKVGVAIQANLAKELGVTLDALMSYYTTGEYETSVTVADVESWIRSSAGQENMPGLMKSLHEATMRTLAERSIQQPLFEPEPYVWPVEELKRAEVSDGMRERLGLTDAALKSLAVEGMYDDEMVEAFALVTGYATEAVRTAFAEKRPVAQSVS